MTSELEQLEEAVSNDDARAALELAIKRWRDTRAPEVAALVRVISERASSERAAIDGKGVAWHDAWVAVANADDALDVDRLAPGLLREPLGDSLITRVRLLTSRDEDPRIVDAALAMVLEPPATSQSIIGKLWAPVFNVLTSARDSRLRKPLERLLKKPHDTSLFWPQHYRKVEKLLGVVPPAPKGVDAKFKALTKAAAALSPSNDVAKKKPAHVAEKIVTQSNDVATRAVAADAFLESGDPRGLAIQLERAVLDGTATPKQTKELQKILKEHSDKWVPAELREVLTVKEYSFRLGFLDQAEVITTSLAQQKKLASSSAWSTLRTLVTDELPLLTSPAFTSLERVGGFTIERLYELGATTRPLDVHAAMLISATDHSLDAMKSHGAVKWPALPKLRTLGLVSTTYDIGEWNEWKPLLSLFPTKNIETLLVAGGEPDKGGWTEAFTMFPKLTQLVVDGGQRLAQLHRDKKGFWLRVGISDSRLTKDSGSLSGFHPEKAIDLINAFKPAKLTHVEIVDMLKNLTKDTVSKIAENVAAKVSMPVTFVPGSFTHEFGDQYDLRNGATRRLQRFEKAAKKRK